MLAMHLLFIPGILKTALVIEISCLESAAATYIC